MVVTTFMSNDATAVVLTPAVFVAAKKAKADPLPLTEIARHRKQASLLIDKVAFDQ